MLNLVDRCEFQLKWRKLWNRLNVQNAEPQQLIPPKNSQKSRMTAFDKNKVLIHIT